MVRRFNKLLRSRRRMSDQQFSSTFDDYSNSDSIRSLFVQTTQSTTPKSSPFNKYVSPSLLPFFTNSAVDSSKVWY